MNGNRDYCRNGGTHDWDDHDKIQKKDQRILSARSGKKSEEGGGGNEGSRRLHSLKPLKKETKFYTAVFRKSNLQKSCVDKDMQTM